MKQAYNLTQPIEMFFAQIEDAMDYVILAKHRTCWLPLQVVAMT
jgi:hypothetical protein